MALRRERMRLGDILIKQNVLTEEQLKSITPNFEFALEGFRQEDRRSTGRQRHDHRRDDRTCAADAAWP